MDIDVDLRVFELLASRLCHDLISPVGAIKSGLELFIEFGDDPDGETMALINNSATQASEKLQCFRLAYEQAGSQRADVPIAEAFGLVTAVCRN
jgi:histidine phosphotransferase ChpT